MTDVVSPTELALLRTRPHRTRLHLVFYRPATLLAGTINEPTIVRGQITFNYTGVSGSFSDCIPGMTLLVGTTLGGDDLGRVRLRSISSGSMTVAENSIIWQDGAQLTVIKYFEPWAVYPRITLDGSHNATFYADYDIVYSDQNKFRDPVPVMGPNMAAIIDSGTGQARIYFDGSRSYDINTGGTISTYAWTFEGALTGSSAVATPGYIAWDTPGDYLVKLTLTNNNGKTFTGYRHICIRTDVDGSDPVIPIAGIESLGGDYQRGGWEGKIWMRQNAGNLIVYPHALVMIIAENWYGNTKQSMGGYWLNRESLLFNGYVRQGSVLIEPETSKVEFSVSTISGRMSAEEVLAASLQDDGNPDTWYKIYQMSVKSAVYYFLRWQTTLMTLSDVIFLDDITDLGTQFADFQRSPLYQSLDQFLWSTVMAHSTVDRQGTMLIQRKIDIVPVPDRAAGTLFHMTRADWMDSIQISQVREAPTSYVEVAGLSHTAGASDSTAIISIAPGTAPGYEGTVQTISGMVMENQTVTNQLAGNVLADANKEFKEVTLRLTGNYSVMDVTPQNELLITLAPSDSYLQLTWFNKPFIPRRVNFSYNVDEQSLVVDLTLEEETDGPPGIPGPYPGLPPNDPPEVVPADPPPPPPTPVPGPFVALDSTTRAFVSLDTMLDNSPVWVEHSDGLSGTPISVAVDRNNNRYAFILTSDGLFRADTVSPTVDYWQLVLSYANVVSILGPDDGITPWEFNAFGIDPLHEGWIVVAVVLYSQTPSNGIQINLLVSSNGGVSFTAGAVCDGQGNTGADTDIAPSRVRVGTVLFGPSVGVGLITWQYALPSLLGLYTFMGQFNTGGLLFDVVPATTNMKCLRHTLPLNFAYNDSNTPFTKWATNRTFRLSYTSQFGGGSGAADLFNQTSAITSLFQSWNSTADKQVGKPISLPQAMDGASALNYALSVDGSSNIYKYVLGDTSITDLPVFASMAFGVKVILSMSSLGTIWLAAGGLVAISVDSGATWYDFSGNLLALIASPDIIGVDYFRS